MEFKEILELIRIIDESSLTEFELEHDGFKIVLKREKQDLKELPVQPRTNSVQEESHYDSTVSSPIVGTFYASPDPAKEPFVQAGDKVKKGQPLCIIEAMKLMNEIEAERDLIVLDVLVQDGEMVEFGQPLFLVSPQ